MGSYEVIQHDSILALPAHLDYNPVREHQMRNGLPILDKFWVINPLTDQVVGDGKSQHNPTNFNVMWQSLRQGLESSNLDLTGAETKFWAYDNDASFRAEITLPNQSFQKQLNEPACLKIKAVDSHNQSFKRMIQAMIMRLTCLNGQISMVENTAMAEKHTKNAMPAVLGTVASTWPSMLTTEAHRMAYLRSVPVSDDAAIDFYATNLATTKQRTGPKSRLNYIMHIHDSYKMPNNAYRVYNTLTHLSTHVETQKEGACPMTKKLRMENEIQKIVQGSAFRELAQLEDFVLAN